MTAPKDALTPWRPMSKADMCQVWAAATLVDYRKLPTPEQLEMWLHIATRARWTLPEALAAVQVHYTHSTEFLKPGHITAIIRHHRQKPQARAALPPANPATIRKINALYRASAERFGWTYEEVHGPLRFCCPTCRSRPRRPCTEGSRHRSTRGKRIPVETFCESRLDLARAEGWTP
ncbi:hypothetical protein GCM10022247_35030 [Allokutzneria multivorans]|uniref:Uncharacterized protein n=1 Tax=Allokutzneria multivorans TaxID=1142134 RepID=A0ABP7SCJ9_9PSEU